MNRTRTKYSRTWTDGQRQKHLGNDPRPETIFKKTLPRQAAEGLDEDEEDDDEETYALDDYYENDDYGDEGEDD